MKKLKLPDAMKSPAPLEAPTPLELAHLSAALVQAGIVKEIATSAPTDEKLYGHGFLSVPAGTSKIFDSTLQYLEASHDALTRWVYQRKRDFVVELLKKPIQKLIDEFAADKLIPVERMVKALQAHRIKPSTNELAEVNENRPWETIPKEEQQKLIFLVLTNKRHRNKSETRFPLGKRREWIAKGVPIAHGLDTYSDMHFFKDQRMREIGKEGAEKKRNKPRAPRGDSGEFQKKKRGNAGTYKNQKN